MRSLAVILSFLLTIQLGYTQDYNIGIGLIFQPFLYKNYNEADWNNRPKSFPKNQSKLNGVAFGFTAVKPLTDNISVRTDLLYSKQKQEHLLESAVRTDPGTNLPKHYYGIEVSNEFNILKLPIQGVFSQEVSSGSGLYININAGVQASLLTSYRSTYKHYFFNDTTNTINYNFLINSIERTPNYSKQSIWNWKPEPGFTHSSGETEFIYSKYLFGVIGGIEFQKLINDFLSIGLGLNLEYDFTNSEKLPIVTYPGLGRDEDGNRPSSHNIRYGLGLKVMYLMY